MYNILRLIKIDEYYLLSIIIYLNYLMGGV